MRHLIERIEQWAIAPRSLGQRVRDGLAIAAVLLFVPIVGLTALAAPSWAIERAATIWSPDSNSTSTYTSAPNFTSARAAIPAAPRPLSELYPTLTPAMLGPYVPLTPLWQAPVRSFEDTYPELTAALALIEAQSRVHVEPLSPLPAAPLYTDDTSAAETGTDAEGTSARAPELPAEDVGAATAPTEPAANDTGSASAPEQNGDPPAAAGGADKGNGNGNGNGNGGGNDLPASTEHASGNGGGNANGESNGQGSGNENAPDTQASTENEGGNDKPGADDGGGGNGGGDENGGGEDNGNGNGNAGQNCGDNTSAGNPEPTESSAEEVTADQSDAGTGNGNGKDKNGTANALDNAGEISACERDSSGGTEQGSGNGNGNDNAGSNNPDDEKNKDGGNSPSSTPPGQDKKAGRRHSFTKRGRP